MLIGRGRKDMENKYLKSIKKYFRSMVNDLGVNPNEGFENPLDKMPLANGSNRYAPPERMAELEAESNPRPEEEVAEWFMEKPDESDEIEQEKTMHEKMYEIATAKYNPFAIGGSENLGGGSENVQQ
jgi:hypothetical protein